MKRFALGLVLALFFFNGCANFSSLQTARVLEKRKFRGNAGVGVNFSKLKVGKEELNLNIPYLEGSLRVGIMDNLDAGLKLALFGPLAIDFKYQLVNLENFAFAIGTGVSYLNFTATSDVTVSVVDILLPLYLSYDFSPSFSLYSSPKYIIHASADGTGPVEDMVGASFGLRIGNSVGAFIEAGVFQTTQTQQAFSQMNVALFFGDTPHVLVSETKESAGK